MQDEINIQILWCISRLSCENYVCPAGQYFRQCVPSHTFEGKENTGWQQVGVKTTFKNWCFFWFFVLIWMYNDGIYACSPTAGRYYASGSIYSRKNSHILANTSNSTFLLILASINQPNWCKLCPEWWGELVVELDMILRVKYRAQQPNGTAENCVFTPKTRISSHFLRLEHLKWWLFYRIGVGFGWRRVGQHMACSWSSRVTCLAVHTCKIFWTERKIFEALFHKYEGYLHLFSLVFMLYLGMRWNDRLLEWKINAPKPQTISDNIF